MAQKKFIRFRRRRAKKEPMHLEMNSLLDVLVILLVFLIKSYSTSEVEFALQKNILAPVSLSVSEVHKGVTIQMSFEKEVFIENELIVDSKSFGDTWKDETELSIKNELLRLKNKIERSSMRALEGTSPTSFQGVINLIMDKRLPFNHVERLMDLSTDVGFEQFKFIVIES